MQGIHRHARALEFGGEIDGEHDLRQLALRIGARAVVAFSQHDVVEVERMLAERSDIDDARRRTGLQQGQQKVSEQETGKVIHGKPQLVSVSTGASLGSDFIVTSLTDSSLAPPGKHVMSCFVQYAPYNLKEGTWDEKREEFGDTVIETIAEHAPNIKDLILHRQVLTPLDIERDFGLSEGNIFQGELTLEQLFFLRPAPGWAQYRTPIRNLYMCGSATHPGGGIMGAPGRNAAMQMLKDKK